MQFKISRNIRSNTDLIGHCLEAMALKTNLIDLVLLKLVKLTVTFPIGPGATCLINPDTGIRFGFTHASDSLLSFFFLTFK